MNQDQAFRQRGIYSEILTTEDSENLKVTLALNPQLASTIGPQQKSVIEANQKQLMPRAIGLGKKKDTAQSDRGVAGGQDQVKQAYIEGHGKILGKSYFTDPEVNKGFYSKKREGVADVDPKGIDYRNNSKTQADWLPLEPFDDTEYDCRLPDEWIEYGFDEEENFNPIPGKGLYWENNECGVWRDVLIHSYDAEREVYTGVWDGSTEYVELTRINLLFNAEDPRIFAQRVAQAHQERIYADSQVRYNFFVDYMPTLELPELDSEQVTRITAMALASKYLKDRTAPDTTQILNEVQLDFARTMNKIIMEKSIDTDESLDPQKMIPHNLTLPPRAPEKDVPYFGMVPIPAHDFPEQFSNFCFNSLYIKEEVIKAMVDIRNGCNTILVDARIFDVSITQVLRLNEFKQMQNIAISNIKFMTRETGWVGKLEQIIKESFTEVGKGWFNIHETNKETYEFGKLKKFLTLVNFMMQDTVLVICQESVTDFVKFIHSFIPKDTIIHSTNSVTNIYEKKKIEDDGEPKPSSADDENIIVEEAEEGELNLVQKVRKELEEEFRPDKDPEPLFALDLVLKANQLIPSYSTEPKEIVNTVLSVFDEGIKCLQDIPQLEPILLKHLFKTHTKKTLKAPLKPHEKPKPYDPSKPHVLPDENTWLWDAYQQIRIELEQCIQPLFEYLKTFEEFKEVNETNPDKYVRGLDEGETPATAEFMKADIERMKEKEAKIGELIPKHVNVSIFQVNCEAIRNGYMTKYQQIVAKEISAITQKAKDKNYELTKKFDEINERIRRPPKNIEELTETKKYLNEIPLVIEKLKNDITSCMEIYDILDEFQNDSLNANDVDQKWLLYGAPKKVVSIIDSQSQVLEKQKEIFIKEMEQEQIDFDDNLEGLASTVGGFNIYDNIDNYLEYAENVEAINQRLKENIDQARLFNQREFLVGKEQKDYSRLQAINRDFQPYSNLWLTTRKWKQSHQSWLNNPWEELNAPELEDIFDTSNKTMGGVLRYFREKDMPSIFKIAEAMKKAIDDFKPYVPLAVSLRKEGMKDRHWDQISDKVGFDIRPDEEFTLQKVIDKGMLKHVEICEEVGERAYKEFGIERMLNKMMTEWKGQDFLLPQFKATPTNYITGFDDAVNMLDEHILQTQAMTFSPFKKPFEQEIEEWNTKMILVSDTLDEWVKCQGQWMYLQPIFDSPDIVKQLPQDSKRFKSVDQTWKYIMNQTKQNPNILASCSKEGLKEKFQEANKNLEMVQKGLADYLERKRSVFARFYFLSNDELLEILSQTKEVRNVRPHLRKVFENMHDLEFRSDDTIWAMMSGEGEKIDFVKKIDPKERNVENWMGDVEKMMITSVRHVLLESIKDYAVQDRNEWILAHCGQTVLNGSQVHWTMDVEQAIRDKGLQGIDEYWSFLKEQLNKTVTLVRQKLTKMQTITINALIVIDVHARDVIDKLVQEKVDDVGAFEWISQLRYYWDGDDASGDCYVRCVQTNFPYGYEYLGNTLRLVITPLTDKCYMTLMGALQLNLGGAPAGPAGTGKTESTKDLAKALAKQCVVFNCSDGMDHLMVAKFFKGLASAGAWACFDEFNRINIEVLSVIAQQLLQLFGAKADNAPEVDFEGSRIKMKPTFCVFITMNPGYAGRTELPDNLKALFRPVAMMVPDYALIGEIMLYSFGFLTGRDLARKMVTTFKLASEQLSSQDHYDYGMRAVRSVINAAGLLKQATPDMNEDQLLLRALRDVNVPKFLKDDLPLFENIILDLFPDTQKPEQNYGQLEPQMLKTCQDLNLQPKQSFLDKIIQLYDTIQVRHGLMIVGPTGGGKTSNYQVLSQAMTKLKSLPEFEAVHPHVLNPKSITMGQLYGQVNPQTTEWMDGVLAKLILDCTRDTSSDKHWVMFDGPVDAIWIENMNTVLDDNKKLCLNSGQIITLTPMMTMMFEVEDLAVASPATVSRCGMVYMEPVALTLKPLVTSWLNGMPEKIREKQEIYDKLQSLFDEILEDGCYFVRKNLHEPVSTVDNNLALSLMKILDCYFSRYIENEIKRVSKDDIANLEIQITQMFVFATIWSIGTTTDLIGRKKFDAWFRQKIVKLGVEFPEEKQIYDYNWDVEKKEWVYWMDTVRPYEVDTKLNYSEIVVPTVDSIRMKFLKRTLLTNKKHVLCPGPTGTGKSVNIQELLTFEMPEEYQSLAMTFSAQTSANQTQDYIDDKLDKRRKGVYGPPVGQRFIVFVDDLNMPKKEEYGAQPPLELLRQWMDHKGWYNRDSKEKEFKKIEDIIFMSAMGPPGGGRSEITQRLQRHFNIITYTDLSEDSIYTIFFTIVSAFLQNFTQEVKASLDNLVKMTLTVYNEVLTGPLKPIPSKSHYLFNLRDISRIFQGVCNAYQQQTTQPVHLIRLWIHENERVFKDRLIDDVDRNWLTSTLVQQSEEVFKISKQEIYTTNRIIFADFLTGSIDDERRLYQQAINLDQFVQRVKDMLIEFNDSVKNPMDLVMFVDACEHVARIERIIRQPLGNALLLGVGGSGRQSLSRLGTYIANYKINQIEVVKGYAMNNWREDVKKAIMQCGVDNKETTFLFVDTQIINEQMLEDINNILNSGDVPNLYKIEDMEPILNVGKNLCIAKNIQLSKMNMFSQYLNRVRKNIHMVIAMSPLGEIFRSRLRKFPSLVNCCTIDWFQEWPEEALLGVGAGQVAAADLDLGTHFDSCVEIFKDIHKSVERKQVQFKLELRRTNYVTPTSFLELLGMYKTILQQLRKEKETSKNRLIKGLEVLDQAAVEIAKLKEEIDKMAPTLEETKKDVEKTMKSLAIERQDADEEKDYVMKEEAEASKQEAEADTLKKEAEFELSKAAPMLEEATRILSQLKPDDFVFIAKIQVPTPTFVLGMEVCCIMLGHKVKKENQGKIQGDTTGYFDCARQNLLKEPKKFMEKLKDFDKENMQESVVKRVSVIMNSDDFTLEKATKAATALIAIQKWVQAMLKYHELLKIVNPKREKVKEMSEKLAIVRSSLAEKRKRLKEVQEKIEGLERMYNEKLMLQESLQAQIDSCYKKLERANKIISGLEGEKTRWTLTVEVLSKEFGLLIGNCLIAAGMIAYGGPFTAQYRIDLEQEWRERIKELKVPFQDQITMKSLLEQPVQTKIWTAASLPNDNLSIENAIIIFKSRRWPLMIDPQSQANKFIKNLGKDNEEAGLDVFKISDPQLLRNLELGIQFGKWVLIENVGQELDPALEPILLKQVDKQGSLRLGEKQIPYNQAFRFFMTTTLPNPHYSPETSVKVTILNFAITPKGLEEQMLNLFVSLEMPDLQKKKDQIVQDNARSSKLLLDIENKILAELTKNSDIGQILEDDSLINILDESKKTSDEITQRMKESEVTEKEIDITRETFRPVAYRASLLFFCIVDLAVIDPMYQYSLQWFANLFGSSVDGSPKAPHDAEQRIKNLNDYFTLNLYENVCRSLFEKHKLMLSFLFTVKILDGNNEMNQEEWRYYLAGPTGEIDVPKNPTDWLGDLEWAEVYKQLFGMEQLPDFKGIATFFIKNHKEFQKIFDSLEPHNEKLPKEWDSKLNSFQKMIVLKSIRPDKMTLAIQNYIVEKLGKEFIIPPTFNLQKSFKDSSVTTPLIFILSAGSDPVADFLRFAEEMSMSKKFESISLGKGQDRKARELIENAQTRGGWALLMNCHLATSFMPGLENVVENLDDGNHRDFRLWLTSMPSKAFPVSVLQNSVKMTLEPPSGLKLNMLRTFEALDPKEFADIVKMDAFKKLLFGFVFFHAIVQDRRKFGPIGWNIPYEFTNEDFKVTRKQLKIFVEEYDQVPFKVMNYIGAEINYGGRVTDDKDVRLIKTILTQYIQPGIFEDGFKFSESGTYYSPPVGEIEDYIEYIKQLPLNSSPEAFGLHENAEITTSQNLTRLLLETVLLMQPRSSSGGGKSRDEIIFELASSIQGRTPPEFDLEQVGKQYQTSYEESMNTVLFQECVRYNRMLKIMDESLKSVKKALKGEVVMSEELEGMANSLFDNMVPAMWASKGFLSLKPLASWIQDLNERVTFLTDWIKGGTPDVFWISGFFFPQAFFTSTLQNFARKEKIAIDRLAFDYAIMDHMTYKDVKAKPEYGVYTYGMFLEGCKWDYKTHKLGISDPKKLFTDLPLVHYIPKIDRKAPLTGIYNCPVYKVLSRAGTLSTTGHSTNFVLFMELPTSEEEDKWIVAGVACFLALRY